MSVDEWTRLEVDENHETTKQFEAQGEYKYLSYASYFILMTFQTKTVHFAFCLLKTFTYSP